jgi:hypothetical protein
MAISNSRLASLLGEDTVFISRCKTIMLDVADDIMAEAQATPGHTQRVQYAQRVLNAPEQMGRQAAPYLARTENVIAGGITMEDHGVEAGVEDAALLAQINASWNVLAGVETGV